MLGSINNTKTVKKIIIIATIALTLIACGKGQISIENELNSEKVPSSGIEIIKNDGTDQLIDYTELSSKIFDPNNEDNDCKAINSIAGGENALLSEEISKILGPEETAEFTEALKNEVVENGLKGPSHLCAKDGELYLTFSDSKENLYIGLWKNKRINVQEVVNIGSNNCSYSFNPNYFGEDHLIGRSCGNLNEYDFVWWDFFRYNFKTSNKDRIEYCRGNLQNQPNDKVSIYCYLEYDSSQGVVNHQNIRLEECKKMEKESAKNACLKSLSEGDYYSRDNSFIEPNSICSEISDLNQRNRCFWGYAMKTGNIDLCPRLPKTAAEIKGYDALYNGTADDCRNFVNHSYKDADWSLSYWDGDSFTYSGEAELEGWIIYKSMYGPKVALYQLTEESMRKLPKTVQHSTSFQLLYENIDGEKIMLEDKTQMPELFEFNENNPGRIRVSNVWPQEGSPVLVFTEILR